MLNKLSKQNIALVYIINEAYFDNVDRVCGVFNIIDLILIVMTIFLLEWAKKWHTYVHWW